MVLNSYKRVTCSKSYKTSMQRDKVERKDQNEKQ